MARKRKPRRRDVYSKAFVFPNGAAFSCAPDRRPSARQIKYDGIFVDEDFVFQEFKYKSSDWYGWPDQERRELCQIMAIRLNTRRAIRELVLPELKAIQSAMESLISRLSSIEQRLNND